MPDVVIPKLDVSPANCVGHVRGFMCVPVSRMHGGPTCIAGHALIQRPSSLSRVQQPDDFVAATSERRRAPGRTRRLWSDAHEPGVR